MKPYGQIKHDYKNLPDESKSPPKRVKKALRHRARQQGKKQAIPRICSPAYLELEEQVIKEYLDKNNVKIDDK